MSHHILVNRENALRDVSAVSILCMSILSSALGGIGISGIIKTVIMASLCYVPIIILELKNLKTIKLDSIVLFAFVVLFYFLTILLHPEYTDKISGEMWQSIVSLYGGIAFYLVVRMFDNAEELKKVFLIAAIVYFIYYNIQAKGALNQGYWVGNIDGVESQASYSMGFGYGMLFAVLVFGFIALYERNILCALASIVGFLEIFMLGSRMAPIAALGFLIIYIFLFLLEDSSMQKKVAIIMGLVIVAVMMYFFYIPILTIINSFFSSMGFGSRTITRIIEGTLSDDSIRNQLYETTFNYIKDSGIFGYGMLSDRYLVGLYCHNIILELLLDFGPIFGIVIVVLLIRRIRWMFVKCTDDYWKGLFLIAFSCSFFRLLVSYSFWIDNNFWIAMAISTTAIRSQKYLSNENWQDSTRI